MSGQFAAIYSTVHSCLSKSSKYISTAQAREIWVAAASACRDCALVVVPCALSDMVVTFLGRRKGTSCFGGPKSTFRGRCKGSERLDFEVQISLHAQLFVILEVKVSWQCSLLLSLCFFHSHSQRHSHSDSHSHCAVRG